MDDEAEVPHVRVSIPLIIRLMEFAREDAKDDQAIHRVAERLSACAEDEDDEEDDDESDDEDEDEERVLTMDDYDDLVRTEDEKKPSVRDSIRMAMEDER